MDAYFYTIHIAAATSSPPFCRSEARACKNANITPNDPPSIESRLVKCLRLWRDDPSAVTDHDHSVVQEISVLLEFYICGCLKYGPRELGGWWSDGVIQLEINNPTNDHFKLLGVTWIDSRGIAPFEIDVELDGQDESSQFAKTVFRIGMLDNCGHPLICPRTLAPSRVLEHRPRYNRDWAMAVELTPLPHDPTEQ